MSGIVEFDVGGKTIKTTKETLSRYSESKLWEYVKQKEELQNQIDSASSSCDYKSNEKKDQNPKETTEFIEIFIDHNPKRFLRLLDCLRD